MSETVALNVEIPKALKKGLEKACTDREISLKAAVAKAIEIWVELGDAEIVNSLSIGMSGYQTSAKLHNLDNSQSVSEGSILDKVLEEIREIRATASDILQKVSAPHVTSPGNKATPEDIIARLLPILEEYIAATNPESPRKRRQKPQSAENEAKSRRSGDRKSHAGSSKRPKEAA
jgi:hypothetical protein